MPGTGALPLRAARPVRFGGYPSLIDSYVLVAHGEARVRDGIAQALRLAGYAVEKTATHSDAVQLLQSRPPLLTLLGERLADAPGANLLRHIRSDIYLKTSIVVAVRSDLRRIDPDPGTLEADGHISWPICDPDLLATVRTHLLVAERRRTARHSKRMGRLARMLAEAIKASNRITDRHALLETFCRICAGQGQFLLAAIVMLEPDTCLVRPAALAGKGEDYFDVTPKIDISDPAFRLGTIGSAILNARPDVCNDIARDPRMMPWREEALCRMYASTASFPLTMDGHAIGALVLFSGEVGYFLEDEVDLLNSLAIELSFAMSKARSDDARHAAEARLWTSEERFRAIFETSPLGTAVMSLEGRYLLANAAFCRTVDYTESELRRLDKFSLTHAEDLEKTRERFGALKMGAITEYLSEKRYVKRSGDPVWVKVRASLLRDSDGVPAGVVVISEDITAQRESAAQLDRAVHLMRLAGSIARVGGWVMHVRDQTVEWSQEVFDILEKGTAAPAALTESLDAFEPEARSRLEAALARCALDGLAFDLELQARSAQGTRLTAHVVGEAVRNERGEIVRIQGAFSDISSLKRAEQRLRETEAHLTEIMDAFLTLDREWRFTNLNRQAERLLQRPAAELLGRSFMEHIDGSLRAAFSENLSRAVKEQHSVNFHVWSPQWGRWLDVKVYPSSVGLTLYVRDTTLQRRSESQLRLLEASVARLNDLVVITEAEPLDEPGPRMIFINDAFTRRMGYERGEVLGKSPRMLQGPRTQPEALRKIRAALEQCRPVREEVINYTKSGEEVTLELDIVPLTDPGGRLTHFVAIERDITERLELEERLRQSQRLEAVGQLTGGVAHDFNNLLTVILGVGDLLSEELCEHEQHHAMAEVIVSAAQRGASLTHRLLAFARRQPLDPSAIDVNRLVRNLEPLLRRTLGEHISIAFIAAPDLPPAMVDPAQLENALLNLCLNSRDAMTAGGRLTIETRSIYLDEEYADLHPETRAGDYVMLAVTDDGSGIEREHLERVFDPFFTTKGEGKGTGLGLAMVYGFVKQSGGHITIDSEPEHGTTVEMYLPRASEAVQELPSASSGNSELGGSETILLVEDDDMVRAYARAQLCSMRYTVLEAADGPLALAILRAHPEIELLFTDVVIPGGMSGRELAEQALDIRPSIKVLYTSGYSEDSALHQGRVDRRVHLLSKPYRRIDLLSRIREILDSSEAKS